MPINTSRAPLDLKTARQKLIEEELQILASLHPTYTPEQLRECRDNLIDYFDFVWKVFETMRDDGRLRELFDKDST